MKTFLNNMKTELSSLNILPSVVDDKKMKFTLTRIIIDAKTSRNLYEKWNNQKIIDIMMNSQQEYSKYSVFKE